MAAAPVVVLAQQCDVATATLAPAGGLSSDWVGKLSPQMLVFQALADFSYQNDMGASSARKEVGPCLAAWGVKAWERVSGTVRVVPVCVFVAFYVRR